MLILSWKDLSIKIKQELKEYFDNNYYKKKFVALILLTDHTPSKVYVRMKKKFWNDVWINVHIFWNNEFEDCDSKKIIDNKNFDFSNHLEILRLIDILNKMNDCIWIIVQLPIPLSLEKFKPLILSQINKLKDIDGLWWKLFWLSSIDYINFVPATPYSVISLLDFYWFSNFEWKKICILWQSNLVWKPLVLEFIKRYWEVFSFNHYWNIELIKNICKISDFIVSATWKNNLIDESFINNEKNQILIDVWYWMIDWKPCWDINFQSVKDKILWISPVPWWVWPLTVACLFKNIKILEQQKKLLF